MTWTPTRPRTTTNLKAIHDATTALYRPAGRHRVPRAGADDDGAGDGRGTRRDQQPGQARAGEALGRGAGPGAREPGAQRGRARRRASCWPRPSRCCAARCPPTSARPWPSSCRTRRASTSTRPRRRCASGRRNSASRTCRLRSEEKYTEDELRQIVAFFESRHVQEDAADAAADRTRRCSASWSAKCSRRSKARHARCKVSMTKILGVAPPPRRRLGRPGFGQCRQGRQACGSRRRRSPDPMDDPQAAASDAALAGLRAQIDAVDRELLGLLNRRAALAQQVGEMKKREGSVVFRPEREAQVIDGLQGGQRRPAEDRQRRADLARDHVGLPRARDAARASPISARPARSASRPRSASSARASCACPAPASTRCSTPPPPARPTSAWCRSRTRPKAWSTRSLDLFLHYAAAHRRRDQPARAPQPAAPRQLLDGIEAVLAHPQALAQCQGWLNKHLPNAERRAVSSNAEGARLASRQPGLGRHRQRARRQRVRPAHRGPRDPGRRLQPHALRHRLPAAALAAAAGLGPRLHQPGRVGAQPARAPCTTCWCRSSSTACR